MGALTPLKVKIDGQEIDRGNVQSFVIERDMFQPDMAAIVLSNQENVYSPKLKVAGEIEVNVGDDDGTNIYKGEVVGLEGIYRGGEKARLLVRGMNKLHRLLRKRKSVTFTDKTDEQILKQVAGDAGLTLKWDSDVSVQYKHVYQHNLSDLEFLRLRAGRIGCHIWCSGTDLYVQKPKLQQGPKKTLKVSESGADAVRSFTPRLSSASIVKKVTVKGWNPEKKELITGEASAENSKLGKENAVSGSHDFGNEESFTVDHPIWSVEEAKALAKARLQEISLSYITGECEIAGDPEWDLGQVVGISSNSEQGGESDDPFNGNYYVMGVTHRYSVPRNKEGGYTTILKLARDAQKKGG